MAAAVVTGGSRGVGAETVKHLVAQGYQVLFCYREKDRRAQRVVAFAPDRVRAVRVDITSDLDRERFVASCPPTVDVLVLNAAGGMEATADYAELLNADSQAALIEALAPRLAHDATVIFPTSLQSHRYGLVPEFDSYLPVARSKHRGEQLVQSICDRMGLRHVIVVSDMIDGSAAALLMDLREPSASHERRVAAHRSDIRLPTACEVATEIVDAIGDDLPVRYVGRRA